MRKSKLNKHSKTPTAKLKKKAWKVFSEWVRRNGADENGFNACYTCGTKLHWKRLQAGHFISRTHLATLFDEQNVKPQCFADNIWKNGEPHKFAEHLIK